jgi:hypothetical protein
MRKKVREYSETSRDTFYRRCVEEAGETMGTGNMKGDCVQRPHSHKGITHSDIIIFGMTRLLTCYHLSPLPTEQLPGLQVA